MSAGQFRLPNDGSRIRTFQLSRKLVSLSQLRRMRGSEQVAAICYRIRGSVIEFLLVQTRGGRWIFPKGGAEPGLTHAQAAALEAFEEAGVHGRMEEVAFTRYIRPKRPVNRESASTEITVHAHLCEVLWLDQPQELGRNPSWFSAEKAKRRLRDDRGAGYGGELALVIDRAVMRIRSHHSANTFVDSVHVDSVHKVRFIDDVGERGRGKMRA
jgi:8-oxo-dGTP pyrophosphatase MutT (NUDIX family)